MTVMTTATATFTTPLRAPKHCGIQGCTALVRPGQRCEEHKYGWKTSPQTASSKVTSTYKWQQMRKQVLNDAHHLCEIRYEGICTHIADTVDKIIPASKRADLAHQRSNMQAACRACNDHKNRKHDRT